MSAVKSTNSAYLVSPSWETSLRNAKKIERAVDQAALILDRGAKVAVDPKQFRLYIETLNALLQKNQEEGPSIFDWLKKKETFQAKKELSNTLDRILEKTPRVCAALMSSDALKTPWLESWIWPGTIDFAEYIAVCAAAIYGSWAAMEKLGLMADSWLDASATDGIVVACGMCSMAMYYLLLRSPWSKAEYERVIDASLDKPNRILILENQRSKLFPVTHKELAQTRELAKTHAIYKVEIPDAQRSCPIPENFQCDEVHLNVHGNQEGVALGKYRLNFGNIDGINRLSKAVRQGGKIIFHSCNVGAGDANFAKKISAIRPDAAVYASEAIFFCPDTGIKDAKGVPYLPTFLGFDATRIYKKGELQANPRPMSSWAQYAKEMEIGIEDRIVSVFATAV